MTDESTLPVPADEGAPATATDQRIGELDVLMSDTMSEYWRGPKAARLQAEYRDLIDRQEGTALVPDDSEPTADEAEGMATPAEVRQGYGEVALEGLSDHDIGYMQDQMVGFLQLLPDPVSFNASFDAADITDPMRNSLFRVAALPVLPEEERLDPNELLDKRVRQIREGLSPADIESGEAWLKLIPEAERNLLLEWIITPYDQRGLIPRLA